MQHILHAEDNSIDIDQLRFERLTAGEGEQPVRQKRGTFGPAHRRLDKPVQSLLVRRQALFKRFERARDHRQQIIEIMRDAAGKLPDGFDLLGMAKLRLGLDAAGDLGFQRGCALLHTPLQLAIQLRKPASPALRSVTSISIPLYRTARP